MAYDLSKVRIRKELTPRREPYWGQALERGRYLGLRKIDTDRCTWIARARDDAGGQRYRALGHLGPVFEFDQAKAAAIAWFRSLDAGVLERPVTVEEACKAYVDNRRRERGEATAHDAKKCFERTVYDTDFGRRRVDKIHTDHVRAWRDGLGLGKASANRTLTRLKAALNLAVLERRVSPDRAREWGDVKPFKAASKRRSLYLDKRQRQALLAAATGAVRELMEAAILTGARAGELTSATRGQFDARTQTMTFTGKTGNRSVPLSPAAVELFKRLARRKLPAARLLVRDDGKPWAHSDWDELVRAAAKTAKLPSGTCLYTLRHSFITEALSKGLATLDVARLVGTSLPMIEKHYGQFVQSAVRDRLAAVEMV